MNRSDEGDLAWALADSAAALLKPADRTSLCAKIGAGEQASAIGDLLAFYANTQAELPRELAEPVLAWIQGYAGSDSEPTLRRIYDRIIVSAANTAQSQPPEVKLSRSPHRLIRPTGRPGRRRHHRDRAQRRAGPRGSGRIGRPCQGGQGNSDPLHDQPATAVESRRRNR
jgi:hypothetical protein